MVSLKVSLSGCNSAQLDAIAILIFQHVGHQATGRNPQNKLEVLAGAIPWGFKSPPRTMNSKAVDKGRSEMIGPLFLRLRP